MQINHQIILFLIIYSIIILIYSFLISKNQKEEDFLISSRNRNWFSIAMSKYATSIGASWFITYTAYIYEFGIGVFSLVIGYVISIIIGAYYITPKIHNISKKYKFIKLGDIVYFKLKNKLPTNIINITSSLVIFIWLMVSLVGGASFISYFNILSYEISLILILFITFIYLFFIGYKGVVTTDILQSIIIFIILIVLSYFIFTKSDLNEFQKINFENISIGTIIGFLIYGIFSSFSFIDRYQLIFSGKNVKNVKKGFILAIPLILISVVFLLTIGYFVKTQVNNLDSSLVFLKAIEIYLPNSLIPFAIIMFFAAIMSCIDSYTYGIASHCSVFKKHNKIINIKINTFIIILLSFILSYLFRSVIDLTVFAAGLSLVISIPMLYLFLGKNFEKNEKSNSRFLFSYIFSFLGLLLAIFIFGLTPIIALFPIIFGLIGLTINIKRLNGK